MLHRSRKIPSPFQCYLSELQIRDGTILIPPHIAEECDLGEEHPFTDLDHIQQRRVALFRDCNLPNYELPLVEMKILPFNKDWFDEKLQNEMERLLPSYPIVKSCAMSPKDVCNPPLFTSMAKWNEAVRQSTRLRCDCCHVVMKKYRPHAREWRCFWIGEKLKAVIGEEANETDRQAVESFFHRFRFELPRGSCCVELLQTDQFGLEVMEMNAFGPDLLCDPEPLSFSQDWHFLWYEKGCRWIDVGAK